MVERIDKTRILALSGSDIDRFVESDFKIRSGLCPNGHGLMTTEEWGQSCPVCNFSTNVPAEIGTAS